MTDQEQAERGASGIREWAQNRPNLGVSSEALDAACERLPEREPERGASTVEVEEPWHYTNSATKGTVHEAGPERCWCLDSQSVLRAEVLRLTADLERVTAERDQLVSGQAEQLRVTVACVNELMAERDAMREVVSIVRDHASPKIKHLLPISWHPLCDALARLDAMRKAAADAAEEGAK